jgi:hypothetical protein
MVPVWCTATPPSENTFLLTAFARAISNPLGLCLSSGGAGLLWRQPMVYQRKGAEWLQCSQLAVWLLGRSSVPRDAQWQALRVCKELRVRVALRWFLGCDGV